MSRRRPARLPSAADRPRWIQLGSAAVIIAAIVLGVVLAVSAGSVHDGIDTIGHQTAPSIAATEDLSFALSDMDAALANIVLAGNDPALAPEQQDARTVYERRREQADADLLLTSTVVGTGDTAQKPIRTIADDLGQYEKLATTTILLNDQEHNPAGHPSADVLDNYRRATGLMAATLGPAAQDVAATNGSADGALDRSYRATHATTVVARWWLVILGLVLIGTLLGLQVWLRRTVRRRVNPGLALATVAACAWVGFGFVVMSTASHQLTRAKKDAFDSVFALSEARAVSIDARADESRYLLDPAGADTYRKDFLRNSQHLTGGRETTLGDYDAHLNPEVLAYRPPTSAIEFAADSDLGRELHNITFPGEGQAAYDTVMAYLHYQQDDQTLRTKSGSEAIAYDTDTSEARDTQNDDFAEYVDGLDTLIGLNQNAFDQSIADGDTALDGWSAEWPYGAAVVIAALVVLGVWPRLAEYR